MSASYDSQYRSPNYNDRPALSPQKALTGQKDTAGGSGGPQSLSRHGHQAIDQGNPSEIVLNTPIDMIILHYTGMKTTQAALERLCDKEAGVSAHYLISEDGHIYALVDEDKRAFHAGVSQWAGRNNVNDHSVGVEIANKGHWWGYEAFPPAQIDAVINLVRQISGRYKIPANRVLGHSDIAPDRKEDPGELFPWGRLAAEGLAIGPYDPARLSYQPSTLSYETCLERLCDIGYKVEAPNHSAAVLAFQRRFCPSALGQGLNEVTRAAIEYIASLEAIAR